MTKIEQNKSGFVKVIATCGHLALNTSTKVLEISKTSEFNQPIRLALTQNRVVMDKTVIITPGRDYVQVVPERNSKVSIMANLEIVSRTKPEAPAVLCKYGDIELELVGRQLGQRCITYSVADLATPVCLKIQGDGILKAVVSEERYVDMGAIKLKLPDVFWIRPDPDYPSPLGVESVILEDLQ